jgi:hypothetical protein
LRGIWAAGVRPQVSPLQPRVGDDLISNSAIIRGAVGPRWAFGSEGASIRRVGPERFPVIRRMAHRMSGQCPTAFSLERLHQDRLATDESLVPYSFAFSRIGRLQKLGRSVCSE